MKYTRKDLNWLFIKVANTAQPNHHYLDDPYPLSIEDIEHTWCRSDSSTWAKCGPKTVTSQYVVHFSVDLGYFNRMKPEKMLSVVCHEVTHIQEGSWTHGSAHNPKFWETMLEVCMDVIDKIEKFEGFFSEEISLEEFIKEVENDPNSSLVDRRMETVEERQEEMRRSLENYTGIRI